MGWIHLCVCVCSVLCVMVRLDGSVGRFWCVGWGAIHTSMDGLTDGVLIGGMAWSGAFISYSLVGSLKELKRLTMAAPVGFSFLFLLLFLVVHLLFWRPTLAASLLHYLCYFGPMPTVAAVLVVAFVVVVVVVDVTEKTDTPASTSRQILPKWPCNRTAHTAQESSNQ
mmetsp:Transcript_27953/g.69780  ORF Transcript_27953/g.69780 Transcript_27953/m.69780 type:complete len:168 (-) Transcript_27953:2507-3010(-)